MTKAQWALAALVLVASPSFGQGFINKLKNKATQELNKLEQNPASSSTNHNNKLSSNVTRKVLAKLSSDEGFDYSENCINLTDANEQISIVTYKRSGNGIQCYAYKNGVRTAVPCGQSGVQNCPGKTLCSYQELRDLDPNSDEAAKYISFERQSQSIQQPAISDEQMKMMESYMTKEQLAEVKKSLAEAQKQTAGKSISLVKSVSLKMNGKTFGPYASIGKFYLSADGKTFYAYVTDNQAVSKLISSGPAQPITIASYTSLQTVFASLDNSEFGYVAFSTDGQGYDVLTSSGKKYSVPLNSGFSGAWYSATGGHVLMLTFSQLYLDGKVIKTFENGTTPTACDVFLASDGKSITIVKDNKIQFADGDYFEYPLTVTIVKINGVLHYKWLALENQEVVAYQKPY